MDRRFNSADWLIVIGGLVALFASVLPWWDWQNPDAPGISQDGYDFVLTGIVPIALLVVVTVLTVTIKTDSLQLPDWLVHPYLTSTAVVIAGVLIGVRFSWSGYEITDNVSRGLGLYVAAAGVVIALIGCAMAIRGLRAAGPRAPDRAADVEQDDDALRGDALAEPDEFDDEQDEDEDEEVAEDVYGYAEEDDLVQRLNTNLTTGQAPVHRPTKSGPPPRRTPPVRQPTPRRRRARDERPAPPRRPASPPLP